jgi:hypothetical protein
LLSDEYLARRNRRRLAAVAWAGPAQPWCDASGGAERPVVGGVHRAPDRRAQAAALKAMVLGGVSEDGWTTDIHALGGAPYSARVGLGGRDADVQRPAAGTRSSSARAGGPSG